MDLRLGGRPLWKVAQSVFLRRHWIALVNMMRRYPDFLTNFYRYVSARGAYPYVCRIRTPIGLVSATLYSHHDLLTVNEIFCREDYRASEDIRLVVDLGSNIGISALYFMTRNPAARVILYEPVPTNLTRLQQNLAGFEARYELHRVAVANRRGSVSFGVEESGRYGGINVPSNSHITVECQHIDDVLAQALKHSDTIDVLKVDIEGEEGSTLVAARTDLLRSVRTVVVETSEPVQLAGFSGEQYGSVRRYINRTFLSESSRAT